MTSIDPTTRPPAGSSPGVSSGYSAGSSSRFRSWITTRISSPLVQDAVLVLVLAVAEVISVVVAEADDDRHTPALGLALLAASNLPLILRRRCPALVWGAVGLATAIYGWAPWTDPPVFAGALVAVYSVGAYSSRRIGALVAVLTAAVVGLSWMTDPVQHDLNDVLTPLLGYAGAWLLGALVAGERRSNDLLRERADRLERDRDRDAERVVTAERLRIARELHDITAHHVAVIAVHAEAGQSLLPDHVDQATTAFETIAASARATLDDLRRLLGVLRRSEGPAPLEPQPGLADVAALVEQVRGTGLVVEVVVETDPEVALDPDPDPDLDLGVGAAVGFGRAPLPEAVDLAAYRVVQEALTNVIRHAGATRVELTIRHRPGEVEVEVADDGRGLPGVARAGERRTGRDGPFGRDGRDDRVSRDGQGLIGMRERVELFGGTLSLSSGAPGPTGHGLVVRATFPLAVPVR